MEKPAYINVYIAGRNISFFNPFPTQYPKAKYHLLLMRRKCNEHLGDMSRVRNLDYLEPSHLDELREFHALGRAIASRLVDRPRVDDDDADGTTSAAANGGPPPPTTMKLGYHALPSFEPLHLHIISSDLDSTCVTKRNHVDEESIDDDEGGGGMGCNERGRVKRKEDLFSFSPALGNTSESFERVANLASLGVIPKFLNRLDCDIHLIGNLFVFHPPMEFDFCNGNKIFSIIPHGNDLYIAISADCIKYGHELTWNPFAAFY